MDWIWQQQLKKVSKHMFFLLGSPILRFSPKEFLSAIFSTVAAAAIFVGLLKEIGWLSAESGGSLTFINEFQI